MMIPEPEPLDAPEPTGHVGERHSPEALNTIPEARSCIADTIAYFSAAEANIRIFLLGVFGDDINAADALIEKARSDQFIDVLLPVAVSVRDRPDMRQATASFRMARSKVKRYRDTFAHGVFATRSDLPDRILLMRADPYRAEHRDLFSALSSSQISLQNLNFRFQAWTSTDFQRASAMAVALLNASHAMSVCFSRSPEEVGAWRTALELQGLLEEPPHSEIYRRGQQ
ncbi:hypothetical protein EOW65_09115 [Sinirhodobacter ferrireducens]|uniref:Uncharacterized protein n=1 Tax=Paenirhodobacter ferrireducens TaxID=1215032 RepID=A0A443LJQ3_9RHOB|nr:hypothetical protein [Sinirhodobacter ferrireducens]RWR49427.1 hypothetical protein EOW65_09115 [Sinirhodobacter ferrireducens]